MFGCHRAVLSKALELIEGCPCPDGCLSCIHDHSCTGYNAIIDKRAALVILESLIQDMMMGAEPVVGAAATGVTRADGLGAEETGEKQGTTQTPPNPRCRRRSSSSSGRDRPDQQRDGVSLPDDESIGGFFLGQDETPEDHGCEDGAGAGNGGSGGGNDDGDVVRRRRTVDSTQQGDGGSGRAAAAAAAEGGADGGDTPITTPRKKQRLRNLRVAKGMDRAREKDIAVVGCWIPSVP
ncbi:unnamed protein product [Scytosiphon promiscuus]